MKPRFTFCYLYNLLILNTFHQAQGMKTNSAVSCLFTIDIYQDHVSIVTHLLLNDGRVHISETMQKYPFFSSLQQKTMECTKSARRAREGIAAFLAASVPLCTLSAKVAVNSAHFLCLCVQLYLLLDVNARAPGNAHKIFGILWLAERVSIYVELSCIGFS